MIPRAEERKRAVAVGGPITGERAGEAARRNTGHGRRRPGQKGPNGRSNLPFRTLPPHQGDKRSTAQPPPTSPALLTTRR